MYFSSLYISDWTRATSSVKRAILVDFLYIICITDLPSASCKTKYYKQISNIEHFEVIQTNLYKLCKGQKSRTDGYTTYEKGQRLGRYFPK